MSHSSLPFTSKLFQLTSLTCALALAGCGGGGDSDTVDSVAPAPDLGIEQPGSGGSNGGNGNNGGGEQVPDSEPDFFLQKLTTLPSIIELSDEETLFTVTVKAVEKSSGGAMVGKAVTLKVNDSETNGITIEGQSTQTTDNDGNAVYTLKLNPQAVADKDELINKGFTLLATANKADGTAVTPQELKVSVSKEGSGDGTQVTESKLEITSSLSTSSVSNNNLNPYGDSAQLTVIAKNNNGARVQDVRVGLGIDSIKGISIVGGNGKVTDANGMATFDIKIEENIWTDEDEDKLEALQEELDALLEGEGIAYAISIQEQNGATKQDTGHLPIALPVSDYELSMTNSTEPLSAYGDTQQLTFIAKPKNSSVSTDINGAKVAVKLNDAPNGVSLATNQLILDDKGQATVALTIAPNLKESIRKTLAEDGISYTVTLSEPNRSITPQTFESSVEIPVAKNVVSFEGSDKKQISSSGGSAVISFRVNSKNGGAVANQLVSATLPTALTSKGLVTIDGSAEQATNDKGIVSYIVRVPAGLSEAKKATLEKAASFVLSINAVEDSGVSSTASSESITIGSDIGQSDITLTAKSVPEIVSVLDEQFKLQVTGKRKDGSAANDRSVKLIINKGAGVTIVGNQQDTNDAGVATFTVNIDQSLTAAQRDQLIKSGISYTAVLTDKDGTQSKITQSIKVAQPTTSIEFASITTPTISELGGSGNINIKLTNKGDKTQAVDNQKVAIQLGAKAQNYGVTIAQEAAITDFNGDATFVVQIPDNLTAEQRADLKSVGINYQLSYVENNITYKSEIQKVNIVTPTVSLNILNATNNIDNQAGYILNNAGSTTKVQAQLNNQSSGDQVANQPIRLTFDNKSLASLLTVNGQIGSANITATTDDNGLVSFNVIVPNNLTDEQKESLNKQVLTATLMETLTGKQQQVKIKVQSMTAAISLIGSASRSLNLNGGESQIEVIAKDSKGNVVEGQKVFLALPASIARQGVTLVSGGNQTTDNSGKATFTIAVPNDLTTEQKTAISNSFVVALSAADASGNITTQSVTVNTVTPTGTAESLSIGANKVVNTQGDTFKVFVRVTDKKGGIVGREVRLNVDDPIKTGVSIANGKATTNNDGVASFDLTLTDGANVNQAVLEEAGIRLTATTTTAENVELEQNYIVAVDSTSIDSYQILASSDKPTLNTGGDQTSATFRVTDSSGGILVGVPVQLSIENLEASGAALSTPSMVTTDASGLINVGVLLAANNINARLNHSVVIKAKIVTPQYDEDGNVSMQVREEKSLSLSAIGTEITLAAAEANLKDGASTTITTTLVDGAGRAIANADMELVDANGDIIHSSATAISNADGQAVFNINEADLSFDSNGNLRVFARALGENSINTQRSLNSIELVKISQAGISFINIANIYNVEEPQEIQIQIRADNADQANGLEGKQVELQTSLGSLITSYISKFENDVIVSKPIKASDINNNVITVKFWLKSELAGTAVLQAKVLGETLQNGEPRYQTTVDTRFRATTPAKMLFQAVKSVITPGGSTEIVATVKDKNDVPVEGQTVVFSRAADSSAGRLSAATAVTNSKGEARVVYKANASSPIGGVIINARLLQDDANIGSKTTNITVSEEAVYTTLAFSNVVSSDTIYYTKRVSISVMDGSGRAVPNQEVSIKSYATEYAQGVYCLLDSTTTYQAADIEELDENGKVIQVTTPEPQTYSEKTSVPLKSDWYPTEDANYNYTLDQDSDPILNEDKNFSGKLEAINPVTILGGTVSEDGYSFITDDEGRADFDIRYPLRYSNWVKVRFDASTFVNGSENTQSINYQLPTSVDDLIINGSTLITPWINNASPFGTGGATCTNSLSVTINENIPRTRVTLSPYSPNYNVTINGEQSGNQPNAGFNTYIIDFNKAFELGSTVTVNNNGFGFSKVIKIEQ
ncbi:Ig-like domain-containing protein [uncultured Psychrobacter sp.]|uniref:Ig-like domain-containing protein n=1 Tax=uncultured Psychrobacter sp. TaxID=259303 RepID=UPI00261AFD33|nr:Ig-like domain-containing protein [uncultured Psychrobacter sp.]